MNFYKKIYNKYFEKHLPLKIKFFNLAIIGSILTFIFITITLIISDISKSAIQVSIITILFLITIFISSQNTMKINVAIFSCVYVLNFLLLPALYFTTGGIQRGIPIYFLIGIIFTVLTMKSKALIITLILESINYTCIFYFGYKHNKFVTRLTDSASYRIFTINFIVIAVCIGTLIKVLSIFYEKEHKHTKKLLSMLEELAIKDPLTNVYNRRFLLKYLESQISPNNKKLSAISIIIFNIDKFKNINDTYGNSVGDEVLYNLCLIFTRYCRKYDIVARYGDNEFIIVLPGAQKEAAYERAEQIKTIVNKTKLSDIIKHPITISSGVAFYEESIRTIDDFISVANNNLNLAKKAAIN